MINKMAIRKRILAGELVDKSINFRFRVYAYRKMSDSEMRFHLMDYLARRDKRKSLKNQIVDHYTNFGLQGGAF